jgi:uncharacterized protein (TIGR02145 family)
MAMKKITILFSILLLITSCNQPTRNQAENANSYEEAIRTLTEFYTAYVHAFITGDREAETAILNQHVTQDLLAKIRNAQKMGIEALDHDPFLNAQDFSFELLETLVIKPVPDKENVFKVCFLETICITLSLVRYDNRYLISEIGGYDFLLSEEAEEDCPIVWAEDGTTYRGFEWGESIFGVINSLSEHIFTANDSIFTSEIRPNEQLRVGEIHTDTFMFLEYTFGGYGYFIVLVHNNKAYSFVADTMCWTTIASLNRGDWVEMQWKIDHLAAMDIYEPFIIIQKFATQIREVHQNSATHDEGVVINGIRWATRNVDMPGTFAEFPESFGMLFQCNRRKGWNANEDEVVENWKDYFSTGTEWYAENDPCPEGWRVPTLEEIQSLHNANSKWIENDERGGRFFGIAPYQIFLPATGQIAVVSACDEDDVAVLMSAGWTGVYWSNTTYDNWVWVLDISSSLESRVCKEGCRVRGNPVRCVAKN